MSSHTPCQESLDARAAVHHRVSGRMLRALTGDMPDLSGAACTPYAGHGLPRNAWDADAGPDLNLYALEVCADCPVLEACRAWALSLPRSRKLSGVVGGRRMSSSDPPPDEVPDGSGSLREAARAALLADHRRSNGALARELGCCTGTVGKAREELESAGELEVWRHPGAGNRPAYVFPATLTV